MVFTKPLLHDDTNHRHVTPPRPVAACPFTDGVVDPSLNAFANDLFRIIITDACRAARVSLTVASNDKDLGRWLEEIGAAQHPGKLEVGGAFFGVDTRSLKIELARKHYLRDTYFNAVKHLGMLSSGSGSL